jgi:hypothetical protein
LFFSKHYTSILLSHMIQPHAYMYGGAPPAGFLSRLSPSLSYFFHFRLVLFKASFR